MAWQTPAIVIRSAARSRTERVVACTLSGSPASRRIALTILRSLSGQRFGGVGMVSFDTYTAHPVKRLDVLSPCPTCSPGSPGGSGFAEMTAPIEASRRRTGSALLARPQDYEVGCIMISQPVFFARDDWVADHADWHPRIQGGKTIDVARGDGQRVLAECLERTARLRQEAEPLADELRRYGAPHTVPPRLGQGTFRIAVTSAYGACAVSGEHSLPALEAAHVRPYADGSAHALPNGLLLRADIHRLCDAGYVTVTPDYRFRVSRDLADDFHNGREYGRQS